MKPVQSRWLVTAAAAALLPVGVHAQNPDNRPPIDVRVRPDSGESPFVRRWSGSAAVVQMRPTGELADNIGFGYGGTATGLMRLDDAGYLSLRGDIGLVQYGTEHKRVPLSPTIGGRILVDVTTSNDIVDGALGLQLGVPRGMIRPYIAGGLGFSSFFTQSTVGSNDGTYDFANTTNHQDTRFAWVGTSGVSIPVHYSRSHVLSIDVGVTYHAPQGKTSYLKPGSIRDLSNNEIAIDPLYSEAKYFTWRVGVQFGH